jgi:nitroreductase
MGIGSVWLGEILNKKEEFNRRAGIEPDLELMAVIALGYPDEEPEATRKTLDSLITKTL